MATLPASLPCHATHPRHPSGNVAEICAEAPTVVPVGCFWIGGAMRAPLAMRAHSAHARRRWTIGGVAPSTARSALSSHERASSPPLSTNSASFSATDHSPNIGVASGAHATLRISYNMPPVRLPFRPFWLLGRGGAAHLFAQAGVSGSPPRAGEARGGAMGCGEDHCSSLMSSRSGLVTPIRRFHRV